MSWSEVASKAMDFLQKPSGLGVTVVIAILAFIAYVTPMVVVAATSWENTNRLERAIYALGQNLAHTVAFKPKQ